MERHRLPRQRNNRGVFTKLLRDETAKFRNLEDVRRFLGGIESFEKNDTGRMLTLLTDSRNYGLRRIEDMLSYIESVEHVELILIRLLKSILTETAGRPLYRNSRDKVLFEIYDTPGLLKMMLEWRVDLHLADESAAYLCAFFQVLTTAFLEPRKSEDIENLALGLRERKVKAGITWPIADSYTLCTFLMVGEDYSSQTKSERRLQPDPSAHVTWISDRQPPGHRHDNDDSNFRNIRVIPTTEELKSVEPPYLPLADGSNRFISDDESNLLDTNFRLLREDAVSSMREALDDDNKKGWKMARIIDMHLEKRGSMSSMSFVVQMKEKSGTPTRKLRHCLMPGSVVALCKNGVPVRLGSVSVRDDNWVADKAGPKVGVEFESEADYFESLEESLINGQSNAEVVKLEQKVASAVDPAQRSLIQESLEHLFASMVVYDLVEVSRSFFSYAPILKALQQMKKVPLSNELLPMRPGMHTENRKPDYLPETLQIPRSKGMPSVDFRVDKWSSAHIINSLSLDASQAEALRHTFSNRVALVQGPPGCGKTFMGSMIAHIIRHNTDQSILCVCYTNHALDQFLEHMLDSGETCLTRIGGRTKSQRIEPYQLHNLAKKRSVRDASCGSRIKQVDAQLYRIREELARCLQETRIPESWQDFQDFFREEMPHILQYLEAPLLEDGFEVIGRKNKKIGKDYLWKVWCDGGGFPRNIFPFAESDEEEFASFWTMTRTERNSRRNQWRADMMSSVHIAIRQLNIELKDLVKERETLRLHEYSKVLGQARIIGATTAGAAKYQELLAEKAAAVVLVEEAGEVLESHILTAMCGSDHEATKHLVLIGDHKQLRPKVENFDLTLVSRQGYNLDRSLFERLVLSGRPAVSLEVQHRMRPAIASLVRNQTYPFLKDHDSVTKLPRVKGVSESLLFVDHSYPEDGVGKQDEKATSKSNQAEARLCIELVRHFILQGYRTDQVVVLTPYLGQLYNLMHLIAESLNEVSALVSDRDLAELEEVEEACTLKEAESLSKKTIRCSTVDNFQGEEAPIIVVSLVRSNARGSIGFLKEAQRVNVLLSRAQHGLFLVGNSKTFLKKEGKPVWAPLFDEMRKAGRLLNGIPTVCELHPSDEPILVRDMKTFRRHRPNGGCTRECKFRMACGHACQLMCHPVDQGHMRAQATCLEACRRTPQGCPSDHPCTKRCNETCGPCKTKVGPITLHCGHAVLQAPCSMVSSNEALAEYSKKCKEQIWHEFEGCDHKALTTCENVQTPSPTCTANCGVVQACNHQCANRCGNCGPGKHKCQSRCDKILFCGHSCGQRCHLPGPCPPCNKECVSSCAHSKCSKRCSISCASCVEPCDWECSHQGKCQLVCGAPCSRLPCDVRCEMKLECGHRCPSVCGEPCPDKAFCHVCGTRSRDHLVDLINRDTYQECNVDEDPVLFLECGHFYTMSTLDGCFEFQSYFQCDTKGEKQGVKPFSELAASDKPWVCPDCRSPILHLKRYGRALRLTELRALERKHLMETKDSLESLAIRIKERPNERLLKRLKLVEETVRKGPMRKVYEACRAQDSSGVSPIPPLEPILHCLELEGSLCMQLTSMENVADPKPYFDRAKIAFEKAMAMAQSSARTFSLCNLRLLYVQLHLNAEMDNDAEAQMLNGILDDIIESPLSSLEQVKSKARELKQLLAKPSREDIANIMKAMRAERGAGHNYGGSFSDHWNECPNGHPFYIGECGQAMGVGHCIECGAAVGGSAHQLLSSNTEGTRIRLDAE